MTDLTELGFETSTRNEVVGQGSAMLKLLFLVVLDLFCQVVVQNNCDANYSLGSKKNTLLSSVARATAV